MNDAIFVPPDVPPGPERRTDTSTLAGAGASEDEVSTQQQFLLTAVQPGSLRQLLLPLVAEGAKVFEVFLRLLDPERNDIKPSR